MTPPRTYIDDISTRWAVLGDPMQFVMRYAPAVRGYFLSLLDDPHDAEDACQDFLLNVLRTGFAQADPDRGRFRHYLKAAIRNAVRLHHRRGGRSTTPLVDNVAAPDAAEAQWTAQWRTCVLERTWQALHRRQRQGLTPFHTILRLAVDHPEDDSTALAERASAASGATIRPDNFRQQLHRARKLFAELLIDEVRQTLTDRSDEAVQAELAELELLEYFRE